MNNFKLFSIVTGGVLLVTCTSCSSKKSYLNDSSELISTESVSESITGSVSESINESVSESITESVSEGEVSSLTLNDNVVISHFKSLGDSIKSSFNDSDLLDKAKVYFVYTVDFLFYDGDIKGIKFNDLSDMAKSQLLKDISTIDDLICTKFPNYKETIGNGSEAAYNKASEIIKAGSSNIKNFTLEKLGRENYNKILNVSSSFWKQNVDDWNLFKDLVQDGSGYIKSYLDEWYKNNFKD